MGFKGIWTLTCAQILPNLLRIILILKRVWDSIARTIYCSLIDQSAMSKGYQDWLYFLDKCSYFNNFVDEFTSLGAHSIFKVRKKTTRPFDVSLFFLTKGGSTRDWSAFVWRSLKYLINDLTIPFDSSCKDFFDADNRIKAVYEIYIYELNEFRTKVIKKHSVTVVKYVGLNRLRSDYVFSNDTCIWASDEAFNVETNTFNKAFYKQIGFNLDNSIPIVYRYVDCCVRTRDYIPSFLRWTCSPDRPALSH